MSSGVHSKRHRDDRDALKQLGLPCYICGEAIDYTLDRDHPMHFQLEHKQSRKAFPELEHDPANHYAAHAKCNKIKGDGPPLPYIGETSEEW